MENVETPKVKIVEKKSHFLFVLRALRSIPSALKTFLIRAKSDNRDVPRFHRKHAVITLSRRKKKKKTCTLTVYSFYNVSTRSKLHGARCTVFTVLQGKQKLHSNSVCATILLTMITG